MSKFICRRCNMEFISDGNIMKLSQHIIDKHHGKMYLPYEMIKDQFIVEELLLVCHAFICVQHLF